MALLLALTLFQHLIYGCHNRDLRGMVAICSISLVSGYKVNRLNWLAETSKFSWESEG
jgi:hypothetical protein